MHQHDRTISRVEIADAEGLQALFEDLRDGHGSDAKAAEELGLTRDTFRNLRTGRVTGSMDYDTYVSIIAALGGEAREFGRGPRPSPFEVELRMDEDDPLAIYRQERAKRRGPDDAGEGGEPSASRGALETYQLYERFTDCVVVDETHYVWSHYEQWMRRELQRIRPRAEPVFRELWENGPCQRQFRAFLERVERPWDELPPEADLRCWLSIYRAVEPLADTKDTWGIERRWQEMDEAGELRDYLKAALKREALLLKPPADLERVKRAEPPQSHFEALGEIEAREQFFRKNPSATVEDWNALVEEEGGH